MIIALRFITSDSFVSRAIRHITWSEFSHVDLVVREGLLGAQADGVKIRPDNYCKVTKVQVVTVDVPDMVAGKVLLFCKSQIGKPYDYTALLGNLVHRDWQEQDSWFCSELIAAAFEQAGLPLLSKQTNRITPGMLLASPWLQNSMLAKS